MAHRILVIKENDDVKEKRLKEKDNWTDLQRFAIIWVILIFISVKHGDTDLKRHEVISKSSVPNDEITFKWYIEKQDESFEGTKEFKTEIYLNGKLVSHNTSEKTLLNLL